MSGDFLADGYPPPPPVLADDLCAQLADRLQADGAGTRELLPQPWCTALAIRLREHRALKPLIPAAQVALGTSRLALQHAAH